MLSLSLFFFQCIIGSTAGAICPVECLDYELLSSSCYGRTELLIHFRLPGVSLHIRFSDLKLLMTGPFDVEHVVHGLIVLEKFVVARDTLYFVRVFALLLSIQSPFFKALV